MRPLLIRALVCCALIGLSVAKTLDCTESSQPDNLEKSLSGSSSHLNALPESNGTLGNETASNKTHHNPHLRFPVISVDFERIKLPIIFALWIFCACLGKIAFHMTPRLSHMFPESCMLILMGLIIGIILVYANPKDLSSPLTANGFFLFLLPPIILDAGYFMPNRLFFDHLGTILMFAVCGTVWNALTIGISLYALALTGLFGPAAEYPILHLFLFSSLISAVDPVAVIAVFEEIHVDEVLFILVFGESLLNDGVTVVLYHIFEGFSEIGEENVQVVDVVYGLISFVLVACGGTLIGILWGFLAAFVTRFTYQVRVIEPIFIFVMSYLSYLNAELLHWSGILAITFCGITMKNYTEQNMSQKSQTTTKYAMKMMASTAETVIFLFLGVATVLSRNYINIWFIVFTILFCSIYRVLGTLMLSEIMNKFRVEKIDFVQKFVISYGGLRGAVAFALAITIAEDHIPLAHTFVTTTIAVVFFTVFVQGITIKPLVEFLGVKKSNKIKMNMNERLHNRTIDYVMTGVEDVIGKFGNNYVRGWFKRMNHDYLQPLFVRNVKAKEVKLFETLSNLKMQDALNYMSQKPTSIADLESLSAILHSNTYSRNSVKEWNLDVGEIEYKAGDRDMNEAKFHHILSDNYKLVTGRRQSTYKRHAVRDDELETQSDFESKMALRARQVAMQSVKYRKAIKKSPNDLKVLEVNRPAQQNGSAIRLKNDYLEESSMSTNPAFDDDEGLFMPKKRVDFINNIKRMSKKGPSVAETNLPWKRFTQDDQPTSNSKIRRSSIYSSAGDEVVFDSHPTMAEIVLPWKRNEDEETQDSPLKQSEFPGWASNKDYSDCYSPTNTLLGKITGIYDRPSVKEIFEKRHSRDSVKSQSDSLTEAEDSMPSLRNSAKDNIYARRGSLRDDPTRRRASLIDDPTKRRRQSLKDDPASHRRGSLKDIKDMVHLRVTHGLLHDHSKDHHQSRRSSSHDSIGFDSLLNTVIEEEQAPKAPRNDHVILSMNPDGEPSRDTKF